MVGVQVTCRFSGPIRIDINTQEPTELSPMTKHGNSIRHLASGKEMHQVASDVPPPRDGLIPSGKCSHR